MEWTDPSVLEAVSWRLASELVRRHPKATRLIRERAGDGQADCLWILPTAGAKGDVRLNRNGTIQVLERFDGKTAAWPPTEWDDYLRADPRDFLHRLEIAAGLPVSPKVPSATPATLTYRILAAIASTAIKSVHPIDIQLGYLDTSGRGAGPNKALDTFPAIPDELRERRADDFRGEPGYRFWILRRDEVPILAFEQRQGIAWTQHHNKSWPLMALYDQSRRHLLVTALKLLRLADQI